jgi:hypothetical protein
MPRGVLELDPTLGNRINQVILTMEDEPDRLVWISSQDGVISAKAAYAHLFPQGTTMNWPAWIWHRFIPPSSSFVVWRCLHNPMPTNNNLMKRGCTVVSVCVLCRNHSAFIP